jgi:beta-glucosidase
MRDPDLMEQIAEVTALEVSASGVDWTFGPTLCVSRDERWGRAYECYGETPEIGISYSGRFVNGLQGLSMSGDHIVATAKHWVGDGGTIYCTGDNDYPIDRGNTPGSEIDLIHKPPYLPAIQEGVGSIMVSFSSVDGTKMHEHLELLTNTLKGELGFDGFIVSDWDGITEIPAGSYREKIKKGVNAGIDMMMVSSNWQQYIEELMYLVDNKEVPETRIDDAVRRILRIKFRAGLFEEPYPDRTHLDDIGSDANRAVAREAVRKSLVLLKNQNDILPLSKTANIFVAGSHAHDIGRQCGGWTISWQGESGPVTEGTTILEGIQEATYGNVTFSESGSGAAGHDVAVVVVGEDPYAEGRGDYPSKPLTLSSSRLSTIQNVINAGVPVVVVLVTGRPLLIENELADWDALVVAWLPGTEGNGVSDVLFGDYEPTGKLPVSWPRNMSQIPINVGDANYDPLFTYGFGLSYGSPEVTIISPGANDNFPVGSDICITATATDNGSVSAVHFYANTSSETIDLGEDFTPPYTSSIDSATEDTYLVYAIATDDEGKEGTSPYVQVTVGEQQPTIPFGGADYSIPGTIQAENFDTPGSQDSYNDTTSGNQGGVYRTDVDVDIEAALPAGFNIGWIEAGEWLLYTVNVTECVNYNITFRLASNENGGSFHLEMNGAVITGSQRVGNTGSWQDWVDVTVYDVYLPAGVQKWIRRLNSRIILWLLNKSG